MVPAARLIYPRTGPIAGYYYQHPDPPISVELRLCPDQGCEINNLPTGRLLARDRRGRSTRSVPAALVMDWNRPCGSRAGRLLGDGELMDQARRLAHRCVRQDLVDCDFAPLIF
jgi:hypothetical protein